MARHLGISDALVLAAAVALATPAAGQEAKPDETGAATSVVVGEKYEAGGLHRFWLGSDYRDLWTRPTRIPVLDLGRYAGGLKPVRRVGGQQTLGLAMKGADGIDYTFRGLDKDPSPLLPDYLRETFAKDLVRDQVAAQHPAGALIAVPLMKAAGVVHNEPRLVIMPDDPALGEFREVFASQVGSIERYPQAGPGGTPGFAGATEILSGDDLWKRVDESPKDRIDARAFLTARLIDLMMGDWDRHRKQWRWARIPGKEGYQPIPEDRDQAFSRYEGVILGLARRVQPVLQNYDGKYPSLEGLTNNGWEQDHWILAVLEKPAWDEVVASVKGRVTDEVIEEALKRMPPEYHERDAGRTRAALRRRRDDLTRAADDFYRRLARRVDVRCTDVPESVEVTRSESGDLEVRVSALEADRPAAEPYFRRVFHESETEEVRLYVRGGNDRVVTKGRSGGILVRVVGGVGEDVVDDSAGGGTRFSDSEGTNRLLPGPGTAWDKREYVPPPENPRAPWIPPRDWGRRSLLMPTGGYGSDKGVILGASFTTAGFEFRKEPYGSKQWIEASYAFGASTFVLDYTGDFRNENSLHNRGLHARASGVDLLRFYGFGNETTDSGPDELFKVDQVQYSLAPSYSMGFDRPRQLSAFSKTQASRLTLGLVAKYSTTNVSGDSVVSRTQPYGADDFGLLGAFAAFEWDRRDHPVFPRHGIRLRTGGALYPKAWDVNETFGEWRGEIDAYVGTSSFFLKPVLALRAGGKRLFGTYPFQEAAYLGGSSSLRGFRQNRFAGDGSVYGSAEVRLTLFKTKGTFPTDWGVLGFADAGRVYLKNESSNEWHSAGGAGVWISFLSPALTLSVSYAKSDEKTTGIDFGVGFAF